MSEIFLDQVSRQPALLPKSYSDTQIFPTVDDTDTLNSSFQQNNNTIDINSSFTILDPPPE
jgi:hypothetical protein